MTIDEFLRIDLESEFDPPSFIKSQADLEYTITDGDIDIAEHAVQAQKLVPEIENKVAKEEDRINKAKEKMKKRLKKRKSSSEENPAGPVNSMGVVAVPPDDDDSDSELDLEGIDDDEIDRLLLKPAEAKR